MGLRAPRKVTEHLTLVSPYDDGLDMKATGVKAFREYLTAEVPDVRSLVLDGSQVTFTLRPLSQMEIDTAKGFAARLVDTDELGDDGKPLQRVTHHGSQLAYQLLRWMIVDIQGWEGWEPQRERLYEADVLTVASVQDIPGDTARWLASVGRRWSELDPEKKRPCTSSPTNPSGTTAGETPTASGAPSSTTAASAG